MRNLSITDFFGSFTQPRQNKRPSQSSLEESRTTKRSRSSTPDITTEINSQPEALSDHPGTPNNDDLGELRGRSSSTKITAGLSPHGSDSNESPLPNGLSAQSEGLPSGSQGPVLMSSQRMVVNGEVIIKNSDGESDSDSSLDDIDNLFGARKPASALRSSTSTITSDPLSLDTAQQFGSVTRSKTRKATAARTLPLSSHVQDRPTYKFSLGALKKQNKDNEAAEVGSVEAWSLLESVNKEARHHATSQFPTAETNNIDADLVASVLKEKREEEDISKLMTAIHRTEALHQSRVWFFFETKDDRTSNTMLTFPGKLELRWHNILNDASTRDQAFLGGFVGHMASKENLPNEMLQWLLDKVCIEPQGDLRYSYTHIIREAQTLVTPLLTPSRIDKLFQRLGGSAEALNVSKPINPRRKVSQDPDISDWSKLVSILDLLGSISHCLSMESRRHTICILCRMLFDFSIVQSYEALMAIEYALSNILVSISDRDYEHEIQVVLKTIYPIVMDSTFRLQLLQHFPTCSPRLVIFRRRLALAYFFHDENYLIKSAADLLDMRLISAKLDNPRFAIRNDTDYPELAATIGILSIGIDRGDPPSPNTDEQENISFDDDVDLLASRIGEMFTSIVDTGASHLKRTEVKEMLETFHSKLLYAVRIKPKPKTMMFGDSNILTLMQRKAFRGFFETTMDTPTRNL